MNERLIKALEESKAEIAKQIKCGGIACADCTMSEACEVLDSINATLTRLQTTERKEEEPIHCSWELATFRADQV